MAEADSETVELERAERGSDLYAAVEAAQYARLVDHEALADRGEAQAVEAFVGFFYECSETWEERAAMDQSAALLRFDALLDELRHFGLCVYVAVPQRAFIGPDGESRELPLAVLRVARHEAAPVTARIPAAMIVG